MKRSRGLAITLLGGGLLTSCASLLGADGDYQLAGSSSGSGGATVIAASSGVGTGGDPSTSMSVSGSSSESSSGSGSGGAPPSWHRYSFDMKTGTWSSALLSSVWTGPNAPPSSGIIAACHLDHFDKLLVFTDAGNLHIQDAGIWLPPVPTQTLFQEVTSPAGFADLYHVPSDWGTIPMMMPLFEQLVIVDNPAYWTYQVHADNTATFVPPQGLFMAPTQPSEPPLDTVKVKWAFNIWNKSKGPAADGWTVWPYNGDGNVYQADGGYNWLKWPIESAPIWAGKPGAPDWATLTAAYFLLGQSQDGTGTVALIGP
jgi:hypothetical protein